MTFNSNRFRLKKQVFYVKKEKKLPNVYHKSKAGNQSSICRKLKESEIKSFLTQILNYFFKEHFHKTLTIYQNKGPYSKKQIFFLQNA
ncbi:hypothetical protein B7692_02765 [Streptococcus mitis]|uniref:Uncharacterized protein n=1 Tax=Streptococcus mitis TaxID=28037 RepID=A0A1X1L848_STRMT|nr:hypothetical protein B7692_02765 [Streptococcus mitis]